MCSPRSSDSSSEVWVPHLCCLLNLRSFYEFAKRTFKASDQNFDGPAYTHTFTYEILKSWDWMSKDNRCQQWKYIEVLAHPNDAIGKVYRDEHSGRVPSSVFRTSRHYTGFVNSSGSRQQRVENLKKHVQTFEVKMSGYENTSEQLAETQHQLATLEKFLVDKFGSELPNFT